MDKSYTKYYKCVSLENEIKIVGSVTEKVLDIDEENVKAHSSKFIPPEFSRGGQNGVVWGIVYKHQWAYARRNHSIPVDGYSVFYKPTKS